MIKIREDITHKGKIPVTILVGFLGSGKTTLLNDVLTNSKGMKVAVIVNDMSEINIDSQIVDVKDPVKRTEEKLIELQNGCICCTLRLDLLGEVRKLCQAGKLDALLIEASGISEPLPIAVTFAFEDKWGKSLADVCYIDNIVTVVDAFNIRKNLEDISKVRLTQAINSKEQQMKTIVELLLEQIEFCNTILLNKKELVSKEEIEDMTKLIQTLNPNAEIIPTSFSKTELNKILNTQKFDLKTSQTQAGYIKEMQLMVDNIIPSPDEEYGVWSFPFQARKPFHPERFWNYFQSDKWSNVIRSKGYIWFANRHDVMVSIAKAGGLREFNYEGVWMAAVRPEWISPEQFKRILEGLVARGKWQKPWGDRRQEIVFIGIKMNKEEMLKNLESCLLTDEEMKLGPEGWKKFPDPLPECNFFEQIQ